MAFRCAVCFFAAAVLLVAVDAAMPPLSPQDLYIYSDHIFNGVVLTEEHKDVANKVEPEWINRHYRWEVNVTGVFKTEVHDGTVDSADEKNTVDKAQFVDPHEAVVGKVVHVMGWRAVKRPHGVTGDMGLVELPVIGNEHAFYTRYLHKDPKRRSMYHESFPHEEDPDYDPNTDEYREVINHYNCLMPNGVGDPYVDQFKQHQDHTEAHGHPHHKHQSYDAELMGLDKRQEELRGAKERARRDDAARRAQEAAQEREEALSHRLPSDYDPDGGLDPGGDYTGASEKGQREGIISDEE